MIIEYEIERSKSGNYYFWRDDKNLWFQPHLHTSFEFMYVYDGDIEVKIGYHVYKLKKNDALLILPHQVHSYETAKHSSTFLSIFHPSYVYDFYESVKNKVAKNPVFQINPSITNQLKSIDPKDIFLMKSCFYKLIHHYQDNTEHIHNNLAGTEQFFEKALNYINANFRNEITLRDMAKKLNYDYNYASGLFNKAFQCNFATFVNDCRINYAKNLLSHSSETVTSISIQCGFNSIRSFNRNFVKLTDITPIDFRKKRNDNAATTL